MRTDKVTNTFQLTTADAQSKALGLEYQFIELVHLSVAMLAAENSTVRHPPLNAGCDVNTSRTKLGQSHPNEKEQTSIASAQAFFRTFRSIHWNI